MAKINLRGFYPFYNTDLLIEISDEVNAALLEAERLERNYIRRHFYNKVHYSLDSAKHRPWRQCRTLAGNFSYSEYGLYNRV